MEAGQSSVHVMFVIPMFGLAVRGQGGLLPFPACSQGFRPRVVSARRLPGQAQVW